MRYTVHIATRQVQCMCCRQGLPGKWRAETTSGPKWVMGHIGTGGSAAGAFEDAASTLRRMYSAHDFTFVHVPQELRP